MKDSYSYPYYLLPTSPFHLETMPVFGTEERIEFFYKYKRDNEKLYIGNISKDILLLKTTDSLLESIKNYFLKKHFENPSIVSDVRKRIFPKICWLTDSYLKYGFKQPISVHYNPRTRQHVIHPGSIRSHVIHLFHQEKSVNCLYFNTGGVKFDFINSLGVFSKGDLLIHKDNLEIELVADHGSIIPHLNLEVTSVKANAPVWQDFISKRLSSNDFSIFCNEYIEILQPWCKPKEVANIEIIINNVTNTERDDILCKLIILAILGRSYNSEKLTVKHKIAIDTPA
jgi:hypothetical protein